MFPDSPSIRVGSLVKVFLADPVPTDAPNATTGLSGGFLALTDEGVYLGPDMLHVQAFIPLGMVAYIRVEE